MSDRHRQAKLLRSDTSALVRATIAGEITWPEPLHSPDDVVEISGLRAAVDESWRKVPTAEAWTGVALLANWAPTPFILDGLACASVESFYHSLKYPENSKQRSQVASMSGLEAQNVAAHRRGATLEFRGKVVEVNSPEHAAIIAEAVVAKLTAHPQVAAALDRTGDAQLTFPYGLEGRNALAQATPLALMIERAKRRCTPPN